MKVAQIKSDKETLERLRAIAGSMPVSTYLREVVSKPGGKEPVSPLDVLRNVMIKRFDQLEAKLKDLDKYLSNAETNVSQLTDMMSDVMQALDASPATREAWRKAQNARWSPKAEPVEMSDADMNTLGKLIMGSPDTEGKENA